MALLGVVVLAVLAHETTHWLILRRSGAPIRPAILTPKPRLLLSLGFGWSYDPRPVGQGLRALSYLGAPLVELAIWLGGAAVLFAVLPASPDGLGCVIIGVGMWVGNWWLPHGDGSGWRRVRREAKVEDEKATAGGARWPVGPEHSSEQVIWDRPVIAVAGRLSAWPGSRRRDHSSSAAPPSERR